MNEQWVDILGYEGRYQASDQGRIRSLSRDIPHPKPGVVRRWAGRVLIPGVCRGYLHVKLGGGDGVSKVHRIVLCAFSPRADSASMQVNHKNGDKSDNRLLNLEWATPKENTVHARENLPRKVDVRAKRIRLTKKGAAMEFPTIHHAARHVGCTREAVRNAIRRGQAETCGYRIEVLP
jgi:hypothetical protein